MVYSRSSKLIPILRYSSLVLLFLAISAQAGHKSTATLSSKTTTNLQDSIIYFGDPKVFVGEPFSISCILSISEPIQWFKDGEIIKNKHNNIRHLLRDEHSFITTETGVEGKGNLIEAKLSVKSALLIHDGKYKCNAIFPYEFTLRVIENDEDGDDDNDDTINQWITAEKNYHKNNNKNKNNFTPNSNELTSGKLGIITTQQIHHQQQHHHHDHHNINGKLLKNDSVNNNFIIKKRIDADNNNKNGDNDDDDDDKLLTTIDTKLLSEFSLISGEDDGINENDKEIVDYLTTSISTIFITESSIINNLTATKMTTLGTVSSGTGTTTTTKATAAATTSSIKKIKTINYDDNNKSNDKKLIDDNKFVKLRKNKGENFSLKKNKNT